MSRKLNLLLSASILIAFVLLYLPFWYSRYIYTDEAVQLWEYRDGHQFNMFFVQGRFITDKLFACLFGSINTIREVTYLRLFSWAGWLLSIPIWLHVVRDVIKKEKLPQIFAFLAIFYLICTPPVTISIAWASCMELFIANTCGLLSGYILYSGITAGKPLRVSYPAIAISIVFGLISLFTYQNGAGCFFIPFLINLLARKRITETTIVAIIVCFTTFIIYYLLFKYGLHAIHSDASSRTQLHINLADKAWYFFTRPMAGAFHFTWLFNEKSYTGLLLYALLFLAWIIYYLTTLRQLKLSNRVLYIAGILLLTVLIYLPSLVVKENYSSNRTLLALNMAVFFIAGDTLFNIFRTTGKQYSVSAALAFLFITNAWYNIHYQFLGPVLNEYGLLRTFIEKNYTSNTHSVYFIRPPETLFEVKYGITRSWDEFGVPSSFFEWVPPYLVKQIIFEHTGSRPVADSLTIRQWPNKKQFFLSEPELQDSAKIMTIDAGKILSVK